MDTLAGVRNWVVAYPGVYVRFDVYVRFGAAQAAFTAFGMLTHWVEDERGTS